MKRKSKIRSSESGQTLVLIVLALIILVVAIVFLFDLQNVIRTKIKSQTAVDAAALTGANWQRNTLNLIGEMNLIKSCTVLITDIPQEETLNDDYLKPIVDLASVEDSSYLLSEMQTRVSFIGPLLGFAAAQQAAKNNGINYNPYYGVVAAEHYNRILDDSIYGNEEVVSQSINGYDWRGPYMSMLYNILGYDIMDAECKGIAVAPNTQFLGMPNLEGDSAFLGYLQDEELYTAINANYWCYIRHVLRMDFGAPGNNWWGTIELITDTSSFPEEAEYLPVDIAFTQGPSPYNSAADIEAFDQFTEDSQRDYMELLRNRYDDKDPTVCNSAGTTMTDAEGNTIYYNYLTCHPDLDNPVADTSPTVYPLVDADGNQVSDADGNPYYTTDSDMYWDPLPRITWATFGSGWSSYDDMSDTWDIYLNSNFKEGFDYYGCVSKMTARVEPSAMSGHWTGDVSKSGETIGENLAFGGGDAMGQRINFYAEKLESAEKDMKGLQEVEASSLAKPYGRIQTDDGYLPPFAAGMVLPVFEKAMIIPVALEATSGFDPFDYKWYAFLTEYLPTLGTANSLSEMPGLMASQYPDHWNAGWFSTYHSALEKLNDPDWRAQGITWLEAEYTGHDVYDDDGHFVEHVVDLVNEDTCDWWQGSGPGHRGGPSVLH